MPMSGYIEAEYGLSQEMLKLIACLCMLTDHVGVAIYPQLPFFCAVGRLAFPIFCFLLSEGFYLTHSRKKYMLRILIAALLSEIPFDMALYGFFPYNQHQNVMLTLLLGLLALDAMEYFERPIWKVVVTLPFVFAAEALSADYGQWGIALIVLLGAACKMPNRRIIQCIIIILFCGFMPYNRVAFEGINIPIQLFGGMAAMPIAFYSGKKLTYNKTIQSMFYLFYPAHLAVLWAIRII